MIIKTLKEALKKYNYFYGYYCTNRISQSFYIHGDDFNYLFPFKRFGPRRDSYFALSCRRAAVYVPVDFGNVTGQESIMVIKYWSDCFRKEILKGDLDA